MTRKRNYKSFNLLLFGILTVLLSNLEASSMIGTKVTSTQEDMNILAGETEKTLRKIMESKLAEKSGTKKSSFFGFSSPTTANPQADLDELAILYQALNYADITAIEYLKRNCNDNGGLFVPSTDPNLCNVYVPILMKTVEGRIGMISSQYILSDGILKAPFEWPEHANEMLKALEDFKGETGVYGAERSLVKKSKDQAEGRPEEPMGIPTASPIAAIKAPVFVSAPPPQQQQGGYSGSTERINMGYQQSRPPPSYQQPPYPNYPPAASQTGGYQPPAGYRLYGQQPPSGYQQPPQSQGYQQPPPPVYQQSAPSPPSGYQQSAPPAPLQQSYPPGHPPQTIGYPPNPSVSTSFPSQSKSQVMVLVPSSMISCLQKVGTLAPKSVIPEPEKKVEVTSTPSSATIADTTKRTESTPPPEITKTSPEPTTKTETTSSSTSEQPPNVNSSSSDSSDLSRENLRWLINHFEKPGNGAATV